jgi:hypothetical protein
MSIQLLLCGIVPSGVYNVINEYCGDSELNYSIKNFNQKFELKNIYICDWTNIKLSDIWVKVNHKQNFVSNNFYYRNKKLLFESSYITRPISQLYFNQIYSNSKICFNTNMNIGINMLGNSNQDRIEFTKYHSLIPNKDFLVFMCKFENIIYKQIVKDENLVKYLQTHKFLPFVKPKKIFDESNETNELYELDELDELDEQVDTNIIGYLYCIKIKFISETKFFRFNYITNEFDKISHINIILNNIYNYKAKFVFEPILRIDNKIKIIWIELLVRYMYQIIN